MTQDRPFSRQTGVSLLAVLLVLVVLAALGAAGWWGWQEFTRLKSEKSGLADQVATVKGELTRQQREVQAALSDLEKRQSKLGAQMNRDRAALTDIKSGGQRLWLINEARALASLASQRLLLTQDALAARRLLKAADQTLARLDDPAVLPARKALALDMEILSGASQVDVQGMVLRLGALRELVAELAVPTEASPAERSEPDGDQSWWHDVMDRMPVTVRRHEGAVPLPLSGEQAALVRLTLDGSLQQAQLALMQGRAEAYRQAIENAQSTLKQWFRSDDSRTAHMQSTLKAMGGANVAQALPQIGNGLAAIEALKRKEGDA
ncbi:uroporphyrinogen-III C-methyltransferase [Alcanivorax sp.]|jgi:uroporphyrin-3 C-methyltransferase|uniref:uroporphyrinogen-III C-methyltransferase n=1 Tax=Alcanivorax sp. TaxID=1872427 RepID=UPI0032D91D65